MAFLYLTECQMLSAIETHLKFYGHYPSLLFFQLYMSHDVRKPVFGVSDQVRDKTAYAVTEDRERREIFDLDSRGLVLSV